MLTKPLTNCSTHKNNHGDLKLVLAASCTPSDVAGWTEDIAVSLNRKWQIGKEQRHIPNVASNGAGGPAAAGEGFLNGVAPRGKQVLPSVGIDPMAPHDGAASIQPLTETSLRK